MSGICEIFPDDPSCVVEEVVEEPVVDEEAAEGDEEVAEEGGEEATEEAEEEEEEAAPAEKKDFSGAAAEATADWQKVKDMSSMAMMSGPMGANLAYFAVAAHWALSGALEAFRYRSESKYYDAAVNGDGTNYWKISDQLRNFGMLAMAGPLAVTSLAAAFGAMVPLNGMLWAYMGLGMWVLWMVIDVMRFIGYDKGYSDTQSSTALTAAAGKVAMSGIYADAVNDAAMGAKGAVMMMGAMEGWYYQQWNTMTDEAQAEKVAAWEEAIATRAMAMAEERAAMAPAAEKAEEEEEEEEAEEGEGEEGEAEEGEAEEGDAEEGEEAAEE